MASNSVRNVVEHEQISAYTLRDSNERGRKQYSYLLRYKPQKYMFAIVTTRQWRCVLQ